MKPVTTTVEVEHYDVRGVHLDANTSLYFGYDMGQAKRDAAAYLEVFPERGVTIAVTAVTTYTYHRG